MRKLRKFKVIALYPDSKFEVGVVFTQWFFDDTPESNYIYTTYPASPLQGYSLKKEFVETMPHLFEELTV